MTKLSDRFDKIASDLKNETELLLQLQQVNSKLVASEHLKSNFLSNIRNEINNPIASVLELSKNIFDGDFEIDQIKKYARLIHSEIFSLDFQLRNIFFSAEIEAGETSLNIANVNLATLVKNILQTFQHIVEKKNLVILHSTTISSDQLFRTDAEKLHLILSNLISNAIQFSSEGGSIKIESDLINNTFSFVITDKGCGIEEQDKTLIFDRFRQGQEGSTKNFGGHGLGLSITKALLEIIDGTIDYQSQKGAGTSFKVTVKGNENNSLLNDVLSNDGNDFLFNDGESLSF